MLDPDEAEYYFVEDMAHEVTADLDDIFYMQLEYAKRVENLIKNPLIDASEIQKHQSELTDWSEKERYFLHQVYQQLKMIG